MLQARFGIDWEDKIPLVSLTFFNHALNAAPQIPEGARNNDEEENVCECLEEDQVDHI